MMRQDVRWSIFSSLRLPLVFLATVALSFLVIWSSWDTSTQEFHAFWLAPLVCGLGGPLMLKDRSLARAIYLGMLAWFGVCVAFTVWDVIQPHFWYHDCFGGCEGPPSAYVPPDGAFVKYVAPFSLLGIIHSGFIYYGGGILLTASLMGSYLILSLTRKIRQVLFSPRKELGSQEPG